MSCELLLMAHGSKLDLLKIKDYKYEKKIIIYNMLNVVVDVHVWTDT